MAACIFISAPSFTSDVYEKQRTGYTSRSDSWQSNILCNSRVESFLPPEVRDVTRGLTSASPWAGLAPSHIIPKTASASKQGTWKVDLFGDWGWLVRFRDSGALCLHRRAAKASHDPSTAESVPKRPRTGCARPQTGGETSVTAVLPTRTSTPVIGPTRRACT